MKRVTRDDYITWTIIPLLSTVLLTVAFVFTWCVASLIQGYEAGWNFDDWQVWRTWAVIVGVPLVWWLCLPNKKKDDA